MIVRLTGPVLLRGAVRAAGELVEVERDLARSLVERGLGELESTPEPIAPPEPAPARALLSEPLPAESFEDEDEETQELPSAPSSRKRRRR